jgi:hypothetical protein
VAFETNCRHAPVPFAVAMLMRVFLGWLRGERGHCGMVAIMRRAKKRKNLSSARHYDQIRFRFHTTKTPTGHSQVNSAVLHNASF